MDLQLKGKRALVTGSSSGIGAAIAKTLAAEGAAVVVQGRREAEARRVAGEIAKAGGRAEVALGDLSDDKAAEAVARAATAALGGIDILVNNAGAFPMRGWFDGKPGEWNELFNQNVTSMVRLVQHLVPAMKQAGWGRVVNIASGVAVLASPDMPDYSVTKAANVNLTVSLARGLTGTGVTVNAVSPGPIRTEGFEEFARGLAKQQGWGEAWEDIEKRMVEMMPNPSNRVGRVEDVADMVVFLCSPRAGYVNGANVRVDGGVVPTTN